MPPRDATRGHSTLRATRVGVPPAAAWCQLRCLAAARAPGGARAAGPVRGPRPRPYTADVPTIHYDNTRGRPRREPPEGDYTGADRTPSGRASRGPDRARPPGTGRSTPHRLDNAPPPGTRDRLIIRLYTTPRTYAVCIQLSQWQAVPSTTVLYYIYTDSDTAARTAHTTTPCRVPSHTRLKL